MSHETTDRGPIARQLTAAANLARAGIRAGTRAGARALADLIVPPVCLLCNDALAGHDALCASCWSGINFIRPPLCDRTGLQLRFETGPVMLSAAALADPPVYDRARAVAKYERGGPMAALVNSFKFHDRHDARRLFGRWLAEAGQALLPATDLLIPVPLNRLRLLSRRFNQSALLADELSHICGIAPEPLALQRPRRTESQVGKTAAERRRNVAGAFKVPRKWRPTIAGANVLLIDDVITTGATVNACARTLKRAGAARVDVLALAMRTVDDTDTP